MIHVVQTVSRPVKRTLCVTTKVTACVSVRTRIKSDRIVEVWVRYSLILVTQILSTMQWNPRLVLHVSRPFDSNPSQHFSDNIADVSRIPFHAIDLDSSDLTVDPFLSEYRWNDPYYDTVSQGYMQDGRLTIRIPISNDDGARNTTEEIRVGMAITSTVRYPDYQIASNTQATVRIQPFGGYIQFDKSVVSLSESSESSTDECDLLVQRLNGKGGNCHCCDQTHQNSSDADEGNVCSETISQHLNIKDDLNLDSPYFQSHLVRSRRLRSMSEL